MKHHILISKNWTNAPEFLEQVCLSGWRGEEGKEDDRIEKWHQLRERGGGNHSYLLKMFDSCILKLLCVGPLPQKRYGGRGGLGCEACTIVQCGNPGTRRDALTAVTQLCWAPAGATCPESEKSQHETHYSTRLCTAPRLLHTATATATATWAGFSQLGFDFF